MCLLRAAKQCTDTVLYVLTLLCTVCFHSCSKYSSSPSVPKVRPEGSACPGRWYSSLADRQFLSGALIRAGRHTPNAHVRRSTDDPQPGSVHVNITPDIGRLHDKQHQHVWCRAAQNGARRSSQARVWHGICYVCETAFVLSNLLEPSGDLTTGRGQYHVQRAGSGRVGTGTLALGRKTCRPDLN